jgi:hypothetical protein
VDHAHEANGDNADAGNFRIFFSSGHLRLSINYTVSDAFPEFPRFSGIDCAMPCALIGQHPIAILADPAVNGKA